jgi:hypothetical protein
MDKRALCVRTLTARAGARCLTGRAGTPRDSMERVGERAGETASSKPDQGTRRYAWEQRGSVAFLWGTRGRQFESVRPD